MRRLVPAPTGLSRNIPPPIASTRSLTSDKAGTAVEVGTADAIVAYGDVKDAAGGVGYDRDTDD